MLRGCAPGTSGRQNYVHLKHCPRPPVTVSPQSGSQESFLRRLTQTCRPSSRGTPEGSLCAEPPAHSQSWRTRAARPGQWAPCPWQGSRRTRGACCGCHCRSAFPAKDLLGVSSTRGARGQPGSPPLHSRTRASRRPGLCLGACGEELSLSSTKAKPRRTRVRETSWNQTAM